MDLIGALRIYGLPDASLSESADSPRSRGQSEMAVAATTTPGKANTPRTRLLKRQESVAAIWRSTEGQIVCQWERLGYLHAQDVPQPPNPEDTSISKRQWERAMQEWRRNLQEIVSDSANSYFPLL